MAKKTKQVDRVVFEKRFCVAGCGAEATYTACADNKRRYVHWNYCAACWMKLTPEERGILDKEPPKKLIEVEIRERLIPAIPTWKRVLILLWWIAITGVAVYLLMRK